MLEFKYFFEECGSIISRNNEQKLFKMLRLQHFNRDQERALIRQRQVRSHYYCRTLPRIASAQTRIWIWIVASWPGGVTWIAGLETLHYATSSLKIARHVALELYASKSNTQYEKTCHCQQIKGVKNKLIKSPSRCRWYFKPSQGLCTLLTDDVNCSQYSIQLKTPIIA